MNSDPQSILTDIVRQAMAKAFGPAAAGADPLVRPAGNLKFGDYQANGTMSLAKTLVLPPRDVAQKIVQCLDAAGVCAKVEIAGPGFINFHLRDDFLAAQAARMAADGRLGVVTAAEPQKIVVDYGGPNVAKEMHVGHLRSTIIGDAIVRVLAELGHTVIRQNHVGDWGTQFGMLIQYMEELPDEERRNLARQTVRDLGVLYQAAKKRFDADAAFAERARQRVVKLQAGDAETVKWWRELVRLSQEHFKDVYGRLGVLLSPDDIRGESFYNDKLAATVADLQKKGLVKTSKGAAVVFPPGFKNAEGEDDAMIVRKGDGGYLYATTDLAAARYRIEQLGAQRVIYVIDARQSRHLAMVFATLRLAKWAPEGSVRLDHVAFGTMLGKDRKPFKTRSGDLVGLVALLDEAIQRAEVVVRAKHPDLPEGERLAIARAVAVGALKYADLSTDRIKDYIFDWERMLSLEGNTAPYLQNAYVRIRSIFRKAATQGIQFEIRDPKYEIKVADPAERALALKLMQFSSVVESVAESLEPHRLCTYLYELAAGYHRFYEACPVLAAGAEATRESRLALSDLTARVLKKGLELLGIETVEQM